MSGWLISIYRQADGGSRPAAFALPKGTRLVGWRGGWRGLDWMHKLVDTGKAVDLGSNGYPNRYAVEASVVLDALSVELHRCKDLVDKVAEGCRSDEWLIVDAWDES